MQANLCPAYESRKDGLKHLVMPVAKQKRYEERTQVETVQFRGLFKYAHNYGLEWTFVFLHIVLIETGDRSVSQIDNADVQSIQSWIRSD